MSVTRIPVDVVMESVRLENRWASEQWQPATVVAVGPPFDGPAPEPGQPQLLHESAEGAQWRFPQQTVELHKSEAEGYFLNITAPQPRAFVMWRHFDDGKMPPARPVVVTLSYNQAARMMDADECHRIGLIHYLVPHDELMAKAREVAALLAFKPPIAMRLCKRRFREVTQPAFDEAFTAGPRYQEEAFASGEPQEAMARFFAERAAKRGGG